MDLATVFNRLSKWTSRTTGNPAAFSVSVLVVLIWAATGPLFRYGDTWQLVINSITNIVTFWMVFLIQNTQNRDTEAVQLKLDELIRAHEGAHNALLDLEELSEEELNRIRDRYERLARQARKDLKDGLLDTGRPDVNTP
jgi:low affinity Fe/Cu permease